MYQTLLFYLSNGSAEALRSAMEAQNLGGILSSDRPDYNNHSFSRHPLLPRVTTPREVYHSKQDIPLVQHKLQISSVKRRGTNIYKGAGARRR